MEPNETTPPPTGVGASAGTADRPTPGKLTPVAVVVALLAGLASFAGSEAMLDHFHASSKAANEPYAFKQFNMEKDEADGRNAMIAFGMMGALTGLGLGLAAGWLQGNTRAAISAAVVGLVLGATLPAFPCPWVVPLYRKYVDLENPVLTVPLMVHCASFAPLGLAAGAALGLGLGGGRRAVAAALGGMVGAVLASILFHVVVALVFYNEQVDQPISTHQLTRFAARVLIPLGAALGAAWAVREAKPKARPAPAPLA